MTSQELASIEMFSQASDQEREAVARLAREMTCTEGDVIFREGDSASNVYILLEGKITIRVMLSSRPESIVVASLSQSGQLVGWSGLVSKNYTASAHCETDSRLLLINGQELHAALADNPALGFTVMEHVANVIGERLRNIQRVVLKTL